MSAGGGVYGKRAGYDEMFGSASAKRSRHSVFEQSAADHASGGDMDPSNRILPSMKIWEATDSSRNHVYDFIAGHSYSGQHMEQVRCREAPSGSGNAMDGSNWVDTFVREMTNSTDLHDAKERVARILEAFEISIRTRSTVSEGLDLSSLKNHLHILLRDNQILKRAVAIQREREIEQDEKTNEVQRLQHTACQCHEQLQKMELTNYSLKIHLQRARENSSIPGKYLPDVY